MILTLVLFFLSFGLPGDTQKITRLIALPFVLVAMVICWSVIMVDLIRKYMALKRNNVNVSFFQFKVSEIYFQQFQQPLSTVFKVHLLPSAHFFIFALCHSF